MCEIDCVPCFVPASDPPDASFPRVGYFVVGHNAIIRTHGRTARTAESLTGRLLDGTGLFRGVPGATPPPPRLVLALCKFARISIPDAKLDGNRRICFVDLVTRGSAADDGDFSETVQRQQRQCPPLTARSGPSLLLALVQSNSSRAAVTNLITADYICRHKRFYGSVVMRQYRP